MANQIVQSKSRVCVPVPVGYRFRPTDEELLKSYLLAKVTNGYYHPLVINEFDVYAYQPWDLPGLDEEQSEGYYFTPRIKKHPNGKRPSRFVYVQGSDHEARPQLLGYWKMSCKLDDIRDRHGKLLGKKNFLNYFRGSVKTEWKMHEFMLDPSLKPPHRDGRGDVLDEVVLCRIYTTVKHDQSNDDKRGKAAEMPQIRISEGVFNQPMITSTPLISRRRPLKRKQPSSYQHEQSNTRALAAAPIRRPVEFNPTTVRQLPSTLEPLTQLVGAQPSLTKLSKPLSPQHNQSHVVNLAPPQGEEEPKTYSVPNETQVPQGEEYTSLVQLLQDLQDFNTWAQCGDLKYLVDDINVLPPVDQLELQQPTFTYPNALNNIDQLAPLPYELQVNEPQAQPTGGIQTNKLEGNSRISSPNGMQITYS